MCVCVCAFDAHSYALLARHKTFAGNLNILRFWLTVQGGGPQWSGGRGNGEVMKILIKIHSSLAKLLATFVGVGIQNQ